MRDVKAYRFAAIENFRDFGGVAGLDGARVRAERLFRSAHHGLATEEDLAALQALEVSAVVDLRRPTERRQHPSRRWTGFAGRAIESDLGDRAEGPHVEFLRQGDLSDAGVEAYLVGYYRDAFFEPRHLALFSEAFAALDETQGAVVVHCTAGKDRTGLLAGLILRVLGVHADDVMNDFLETNRVMMTPERVAAAAVRLKATGGGREPTPAILQGFMGVSAHHLEAAFAAIDAVPGGQDAYLARIGVDAARREHIRTRLLV